jgi:cell pole-organizing protein PopZ
MTQPAKSQEPSMEEILASIRRIIADDDATRSVLRSPEPARSEPPPPQAPVQPVPQVQPPVQAVAPVQATHFQAAPVQVAPVQVAPVVVARPRLEPAPPPEPPAEETVADQAADILDLTESMAAPSPNGPVSKPALQQPQFRTIEVSGDIGFDDVIERVETPAEEEIEPSPVAQAAPQSAPQAAPPPRMPAEPARLLSTSASAAVDSAFNTLAQTVLAQNARTLEDLVREMLRPMLKAWLDDNLPALVERLVRAEIERVSRGRAG